MNIEYENNYCTLEKIEHNQIQGQIITENFDYSIKFKYLVEANNTVVIIQDVVPEFNYDIIYKIIEKYGNLSR